MLKLDELSVLECLLHIGLVQHCVVPPREAPEGLHTLVALGIKGQEGGEEGQIGQGEPLPHQESVVPEEAVEPLQLLAGRGCGACNNNTASNNISNIVTDKYSNSISNIGTDSILQPLRMTVVCLSRLIRFLKKKNGHVHKIVVKKQYLKKKNSYAI